MKKIVALVLCLVLALSLCTVAMAAYRPATTAMGTLTTVGGHTVDTATYDYTMTTVKAGNDVAKTFDYVSLVANNKTTKAQTKLGDYVVAADATSADLALVEGSNIVFLATYTPGTAYDVVATPVATVKVASLKTGAACGQMYTYGDEAVYTAGGKYYVTSATGGKTLSVNGKYVEAAEVAATAIEEKTVAEAKAVTPTTAADGKLYSVKHTYKVATATDAKGVISATAVTCSDCKANFNFVVGTATDATLKFGDNNFITDPNNTELDAGTLYIQTGTTSGNTTDKTVESAKTFDAGIALYAGMALASVAGSAVVIGKKKEF